MKLNHHAYIIERVGEEGFDNLLGFIADVLEIDKDPHSSPNFLHIKSNQLSVDDAEKIVAFNSQKSFGQNGGGNKVVLIEMNGAGHQAQNAILKTLEEPFPNTYFFILISSVSLLLPTIKSRVETYSIKDFFKNFNISTGTESDELNKTYSESIGFLKLGIAERLDVVKGMIEESSKDENDDTSGLFKFLHEMEITLKNLEKGALKRRLNKSELEALVKVREYFGDAGASKKMLLEYLSISLPQI